MQFSKKTSTSNINFTLVKMILVLVIIIGAVVLMGKIDFPSPNKEIKKIIPNEKLKTVK
jgi:competence protein ComGC